MCGNYVLLRLAGVAWDCESCVGRLRCLIKLVFHDTDTDTDTDILARILADAFDARFPEVIPIYQRRASILATILARMSASKSVSASVSLSAPWNASFSRSFS